MSPKVPVRLRPIQAGMIAPCGMNCALCIGHLREKNRCPGCNHRDDAIKAGACRRCSIKLCEKQGQPNRYCFNCSKFPCRRLKDLDKRYRNNYGMSMLDNLEFIQAFGIRKFIAQEKIRWACDGCGRTVSVHRKACPHCGQSRVQPPPSPPPLFLIQSARDSAPQLFRCFLDGHFLRIRHS
jgi:Protein of unknown function (DUF3795)